MYRNLVFDLGGVVVNYNPRDFLVDKFYHERTERRVFDAVFGSPEWLEMDRGTLSWDEAVKIFKKRGREKELRFEIQTVLDEWTEMLTTRTVTVTLMRLLKKRGYRLFYLTNMSTEVLAMLQQRDFWPLFDGGLASCEVGLLKPEPEIYARLVQRYGLRPEETIFTDDHLENAAAAQAVGLTGIHFTDVKSFCQALVSHGVEV